MKKTESQTLQDKSFTTTLLVTQSPGEVFDAVNNVRGWWSESIEGITDQLNAEFLQYYRDIHIAKMKIIEFTPGKKVTWLVVDSRFSFTKIQNEWKDTKICFEISRKGDKTQLLFTHQGLVPAYECYDVCDGAWTDLINISLRGLITKGKGHPNPKEEKAFNPIQAKRWKLANG
ncbi:SRPBCC domain-containing protein [Flavitalea sp. BT771]|uniref:SRPBCC domain-containing protein n=1 Tax=Flavitalea sp. BT771 TaxID=3063329 RepID=UPI0026E3BA26|nr:SRPBCC domain-containing protein [Flavitalea sp. BT771]MDO6435622.1 SRPBCC domain-containing protein [Flavitalea sp. BT771]MDV6224522.1 SRPBCC domain-containing protein [Flavitalea sp. BT771]